MIDDIFAAYIRKYNLNDQLIKDWMLEQYENERDNITSPFRLHLTEVPTNITQDYFDVTEKLLDDLKISDTCVAIITGIMLTVLEKGDSMDRCNTLPSHYTATHYISGSDPDVYHHPAKDLIQLFNPGLDEWSSATSLYVNEGDVIVHPSYLEYNTPVVQTRRATLTLLINIQPR